MTPDKLELAPW